MIITFLLIAAIAGSLVPLIQRDLLRAVARRNPPRRVRVVLEIDTEALRTAMERAAKSTARLNERFGR